MSEKWNIFDIIKNCYYPSDFQKMFQNSLYKNYNIVLLGEDITKWDSTKAYNTDDVVYVYKLGEYKIYVSLIDNNTEPLNNDGAWKDTDNTFIDKTELEALISLINDILPGSLLNLYTDNDNTPGINKLKYIIGLFLACYIANKNNDDGNWNSGGKIATYQSIDGLTASYTIPSYALDVNNLFYTSNPYGMELLSLYKKLFVSKYADTRENLYIVENFRQDPSGFIFSK